MHWVPTFRIVNDIPTGEMYSVSPPFSMHMHAGGRVWTNMDLSSFQGEGERALAVDTNKCEREIEGRHRALTPASQHATSLALSDLHFHFTFFSFFALFSHCPAPFALDRAFARFPLFFFFFFLFLFDYRFFRTSTKSQVLFSPFPHLPPHVPFPFPASQMTSSDGMSTFLRLLLLLSLGVMSIANAEYRSYNGTGNNRANPLAGSAWTPFLQNHTIAKAATYPEQQQPLSITCPISPPAANSWAAGRCVSNIAMSYDTPVNNTVQRQKFVSMTFRTHMVQKWGGLFLPDRGGCLTHPIMCLCFQIFRWRERRE